MRHPAHRVREISMEPGGAAHPLGLARVAAGERVIAPLLADEPTPTTASAPDREGGPGSSRRSCSQLRDSTMDSFDMEVPCAEQGRA